MPTPAYQNRVGPKWCQSNCACKHCIGCEKGAFCGKICRLVDAELHIHKKSRGEVRTGHTQVVAVTTTKPSIEVRVSNSTEYPCVPKKHWKTRATPKWCTDTCAPSCTSGHSCRAVCQKATLVPALVDVKRQCSPTLAYRNRVSPKWCEMNCECSYCPGCGRGTHCRHTCEWVTTTKD